MRKITYILLALLFSGCSMLGSSGDDPAIDGEWVGVAEENGHELYYKLELEEGDEHIRGDALKVFNSTDSLEVEVIGHKSAESVILRLSDGEGFVSDYEAILYNDNRLLGIIESEAGTWRLDLTKMN